MTSIDSFRAEIDALAAELPAAPSPADLDAMSADELEQALAAAKAVRGQSGGFKKQIGALDGADRSEAGKLLGAFNQSAQALIDEFAGAQHRVARRAQLADERLDLSEVISTRRRGSAHLVTQAWERLEDVFVGMGYTVSEGPEIESDWYNFEALNFPAGHTARDLFDTLYVNVGNPESVLLRTHTSPVQVRTMESTEPPIYTVSPGRVFRRDTADATHMPVFHQIEGLVVDRGVTLGDLAGTIESFVTSYFGGGFTSRLRPSYFPFTEPSAEFDIRMPNGAWLELGGCGMVHPNVLSNVGIDPEEWSGFAFGFGIDRLALMRHGVDDLREFYTNDLRFLEQF